MLSSDNIENSPIRPGVDGKVIKTFEQLLDEKLSKEELQSQSQENGEENVVKKPFLKKGQGLVRFQCKNDANVSQTQVSPQKKKIIKKNDVFILKRDQIGKKNNIKVKHPVLVHNDLIKQDDDIADLEFLLEKIENKKSALISQLNDANDWVDISDEESKENSLNSSNSFSPVKNKKSKSKRKVIVSNKKKCNLSKKIENDLCVLEKPNESVYTSLLKKQISTLENKLDSLKISSETLKNPKNDRQLDQLLQTKDDEIEKLKLKLETLNNRLKNVEYHHFKSKNDSQKKFPLSGQNALKTSKGFISQHNGDAEVIKYDNYTLVQFLNGDHFKVMNDNTIFYSYVNGIHQISHPDGLKIINFPDGQVEKVLKNGVKQIHYPNGLQRIINTDGSEEILMQDGTLLRIYSNGTESLEFPSGDREIRTHSYQRREYVNGTVKTIYSDGTQETRYTNGRLRIKDKHGHLIVDSMMKHLNEFDIEYK